MDFSNFAWREIKDYMMDDRFSVDHEVDKMLQDKSSDPFRRILYRFALCIKFKQFYRARQCIDDVNRMFDTMIEEIYGMRQWDGQNDRDGWIDEEDQSRYDELQENIKQFDVLEKLYLMVSYKEQGFDWVNTGLPRKFVSTAPPRKFDWWLF